jgi:hypothetical protein
LNSFFDLKINASLEAAILLEINADRKFEGRVPAIRLRASPGRRATQPKQIQRGREAKRR